MYSDKDIRAAAEAGVMPNKRRTRFVILFNNSAVESSRPRVYSFGTRL